MSNIQVFQDAFAVDFPVQIAEQVLGRIEMIYGADFQKHYGHLGDEELLNLTCTVLNGLTPVELRRGIDRMNSEKWCPKLPEFRSWCVSGGDWWDAELAWAKALQFENDNSKAITTLAKCALDEVRQIMTVQGQKAAHRSFISIYDDYLQRAKAQNKTQQMWKAAKALPDPEENHKPLKNVNVKEMLAKVLKSGVKA